MKNKIKFAICTILLIGTLVFVSATNETTEKLPIIEQSLLSYEVVENMPEDVTILVQFFERENETVVKNITLSKSNSTEDADITITLPEEYINKTLCEAGVDAINRGELVYETDMSSWEIFWKFRRLSHLGECVLSSL